VVARYAVVVIRGRSVRTGWGGVCIVLGLSSVTACGTDSVERVAVPEAHAVEVGGDPSMPEAAPAVSRHLVVAPPTSTTAPPPATTIPPSQRTSPSAGCEVGARLDAGVHRRPWLGVERQVIVRLPSSEAPAPVPVVFNLHGSAASAATHEAYIHFSAPASQRGYLVLTPEGMPPAEGQFQVWEFLPGVHPDDPGYLASLVDWIAEAHCVDLDRVFATGFSNGATMTNVLACHTGGRFRAVAGVAAHRFPIVCPSGPVSVLGIHGTADPIVPYLGGPLLRRPEIWMPPVEETFDQWARAGRCEVAPRFEVVAEEVTRRTWSRCARDAQVVLYSVEGGGHGWPWAGDPMHPGKIDATTVILDFFDLH
jgi:polyhydroxybutyrate depolymerase